MRGPAWASASVAEAFEVEAGETHRGSRRRKTEPHHKAGYTSAVVTINLSQPTFCNREGVHIHPDMQQYSATITFYPTAPGLVRRGEGLQIVPVRQGSEMG